MADEDLGPGVIMSAIVPSARLPPAAPMRDSHVSWIGSANSLRVSSPIRLARSSSDE
jgi:hypothetical protein